MPAAGASDRQIMIAGRWKSLAFKKYIRPAIIPLWPSISLRICDGCRFLQKQRHFTAITHLSGLYVHIYR